MSFFQVIRSISKSVLIQPDHNQEGDLPDFRFKMRKKKEEGRMEERKMRKRIAIFYLLNSNQILFHLKAISSVINL